MHIPEVAGDAMDAVADDVHIHDVGGKCRTWDLETLVDDDNNGHLDGDCHGDNSHVESRRQGQRHECLRHSQMQARDGYDE